MLGEANKQIRSSLLRGAYENNLPSHDERFRPLDEIPQDQNQFLQEKRRDPTLVQGVYGRAFLPLQVARDMR